MNVEVKITPRDDFEICDTCATLAVGICDVFFDDDPTPKQTLRHCFSCYPEASDHFQTTDA